MECGEAVRSAHQNCPATFLGLERSAGPASSISWGEKVAASSASSGFLHR